MNNWVSTEHALPKLYSTVEVSDDGIICSGELEYTNKAEYAEWGHYVTGFACLWGYFIKDPPKYWRYKN